MHQDNSTRRHRHANAKAARIDMRPALRLAVPVSMIAALLYALHMLF